MQIHLLVLGAVWQLVDKLKLKIWQGWEIFPTFSFFLCNFEKNNRHDLKIFHDAD